MVEQCAQAVEIQQQPAVVVGQLERDFQYALLCVVQFQHASQQGRAHFENDCAHRRAGLAVGCRYLSMPSFPSHAFSLPPGSDAVELRHACDVALDVGEEHRRAEAREVLRQHHQRHGFAGAPVAPSIMPWRLPNCGSSSTVMMSFLPIRMLFARLPD